QEFSELEQGTRFLEDSSDDHRVLLLQDPLGGNMPSKEPFRDLQLLRRCIAYARASRKLIVAQNQDRLFDVLQVPSLAECNTQGCQWIDLSFPKASFLAEAWNRMAGKHNVRLSIHSEVSKALENEVLDLEVGCLRHLAFTAEELPPRTTLADIVAK